MVRHCHNCGVELEEIDTVVRESESHLDRILRVQAIHTQLLEAILSDQAHLDADVTALLAGLAAVEAEIAALKNVPTSPPLDFTGLDAAVAQLTADAPAPATPPTP